MASRRKVAYASRPSSPLLVSRVNLDFSISSLETREMSPLSTPAWPLTHFTPSSLVILPEERDVGEAEGSGQDRSEEEEKTLADRETVAGQAFLFLPVIATLLFSSPLLDWRGVFHGRLQKGFSSLSIDAVLAHPHLQRTEHAALPSHASIAAGSL